MIKESIIRLMTRLANEHRAINLAQGFTDEPAIYEMVWGGIAASLGGTPDNTNALEEITLEEIQRRADSDPERFLKMRLKEVLRLLPDKRDLFNQYSYPFGMAELRAAVADYTERFQGFRPDPDTEVTIVAGATEGVFTSLRTVCNPGDEVIVIQPFHEMYPSQAAVLSLNTQYVTLKENSQEATWDLDIEELERAMGPRTRALVLNTPHNPTGKVFTQDEMGLIAYLCKKHNVVVITDEIYEHIVYGGRKHCSIATLEGMRERTFVVNAISKTGNATGWRVGWIISPRQYLSFLRSIHDTLVIQAPTPLQKGAERLLRLEDAFFQGFLGKYEAKYQLLLRALQDVGFLLTPPAGAYYLFADYTHVPALRGMSPMDAAIYLIKEIGVASVPGDNFYTVGNYGDTYLRFAFCRSMQTLEEGAKRMEKLKQIG
ncbi:MAG: aminotransferase class I/II-fold pyridoxal phosphate-dependent enzyme [Candidatus Tectomicrobia bacterium]|uniref:Aminotransferase class I/II-fold pyridoxal phosphate-dependent enzyme n=1 Tax=Tectimicrobiota bacterium TaxID=2528274 RepID=A0A932FW85_UNCTE|nr:aminotransferase class I/II-fold pyridoxal phosphate-dependent enzyme [Candidatus Tectomicrobia bacterium]